MQRQFSRSRAYAPEADSNFETDADQDNLLDGNSPQWCAPSTPVTSRHSVEDATRRDADMYLPEASFRDGIGPLLGSGSHMPNGHSL